MPAPSDTAFRRICRPPILHRSFRVALVVGTILNLINQGDRFLGDGDVNWYKVALTYMVPFCVASYGAWCALRDREKERTEDISNNS